MRDNAYVQLGPSRSGRAMVPTMSAPPEKSASSVPSASEQQVAEVLRGVTRRVDGAQAERPHRHLVAVH